MTKRRLILWISVICLLAILIPGTAMAATNGWNKNSDGTWSYYQSGYWYRNGVYNISGKYYGFDSDGIMLANEWFLWDHGQRYYFTADGTGADDFLKIGNTWYFFENGRMVTDQLVQAKDGRYYYLYNEGKSYASVPVKGWFQAGGKHYYHVGGGELHRDKVVQIGSKYYGFDGSGRMYADQTFSMGGHHGMAYGAYRAKADGSLYVNAWYMDEYGYWYYYGNGGAAASGYTQIGSAWYSFGYEGIMRTSYYTSINGKYYAFGADGAQITARGKQNAGGFYVFVKEDGTIARNQWIQIGSDWYYFTPRMKANELATIDGSLYAVNNAGVCVAVTKNGFYNIGENGRIYVENGKPIKGWKQIGNYWYYFNTNMYANGIYNINGQKYVFDHKGRMFTGGWLLLGNNSTKGFYNPDLYANKGFGGYEDDGSEDNSYNDDKGYYDAYRTYVYANASGNPLTGVQTIGGKKYVFSNSGYLYMGTTVYVDGVAHVVNKQGELISNNGDGWKLVDGKYYYVKNNAVIYDAVINIGGKYYAFDYNGVMISNAVYWSYEGRVLAGADGALLTGGWHQLRGYWYYTDAYGIVQEGRKTIGGKTYILNPTLRTGTFWEDGLIVTTDKNGVVVSEKDPADGWSYVDGVVYYFRNGQPYSGWVGDYLILDGEMCVNDYWYWNGSLYAFDTTGKYVRSGWHRFKEGDGSYSQYIYAKAGGKLCCDEWLQYGGKWYYFSNVFMLSGGVYNVSGNQCRFDANGVYLGNVSVSGSDGWKQVGAKWYYLHAGEPLRGLQQIGGKRYLFDWDGVLQTNGFHMEEYGYLYYTDSNGAIPDYTGWKKINGEWCYFNSNNMPMAGWFCDGDKEYYCQVKWKDGKISVGMVTGYMYIDGELYYFDINGVCQGTRGVNNGWYQAGGKWYYFKYGKVLTGYQVIGGKGYYLSNGAMVTDAIMNGRYFNASGVQRTKTGWYESSYGWIYVTDTGKLLNGVHKIDGRQYCFVNYVMVG